MLVYNFYTFRQSSLATVPLTLVYDILYHHYLLSSNRSDQINIIGLDVLRTISILGSIDINIIIKIIIFVFPVGL